MNTNITRAQYKAVVSTLKSEIIKLTEAQKIRKPEFKQAQRDGDWRLENTLRPNSFATNLTLLHIIYNEFRNKPSHTHNDNEFKNGFSNSYKKLEAVVHQVISETVEVEEVA
jgi:hypothetical protein